VRLSKSATGTITPVV